MRSDRCRGGDHLPSQLPRRGYSSTTVDLGPVLHWQRPTEAFSGKLPRRRVKCTTGFTAARSQRSKEPRLVSAAILHTAHPNGHLDGQLRSDPAFVRRTEAGRTAVAAEASVCRVVLTAVACLSSLYATVVRPWPEWCSPVQTCDQSVQCTWSGSCNFQASVLAYSAQPGVGLQVSLLEQSSEKARLIAGVRAIATDTASWVTPVLSIVVRLQAALKN